MNEELQRTEEWFAQRLGKITASKIGMIMNPGRKDIFTETGLSYLREVLAERLTGERKQISGPALDWGTEHEDDAIKAYTEATGLEVEPLGFVPLMAFEDYAGGSPDGKVKDEKGIIEVKCPYNSAGQVETLINKDFQKKSADLYYAQIQFNIFATKMEFCDFISYDPRMKANKHKVFVKRIHRDEEFIARIKERLTLAIEHLNRTGLMER